MSAGSRWESGPGPGSARGRGWAGGGYSHDTGSRTIGQARVLTLLRIGGTVAPLEIPMDRTSYTNAHVAHVVGVPDRFGQWSEWVKFGPTGEAIELRKRNRGQLVLPLWSPRR